MTDDKKLKVNDFGPLVEELDQVVDDYEKAFKRHNAIKRKVRDIFYDKIKKYLDPITRTGLVPVVYFVDNTRYAKGNEEEFMIFLNKPDRKGGGRYNWDHKIGSYYFRRGTKISISHLIQKFKKIKKDIDKAINANPKWKDAFEKEQLLRDLLDL